MQALAFGNSPQCFGLSFRHYCTGTSKEVWPLSPYSKALFELSIIIIPKILENVNFLIPQIFLNHKTQLYPTAGLEPAIYSFTENCLNHFDYTGSINSCMCLYFSWMRPIRCFSHQLFPVVIRWVWKMVSLPFSTQNYQYLTTNSLTIWFLMSSQS